MSFFTMASRTFSTNASDIIRQLFKKTEKKGFDSVLKNVKIISCENGKCLAEMKVEEEHTNPMQTLHGGLSATIIDSISSFALLTYNNKNYMMPSVSVDMHLSYLKGAMLGDEIIIDAETLKAGQKLAYLKCVIRDKATGDVLTEGNHIKCYIENAKPFTELLKQS